ncbi:MAG: hypothetical protein K2L73_05535 [Muribaculaceae bacterium]|nr:hypothetical protein [Muribaculaceae bacterium]
MLKKLLAVTAVALTVILSGCNPTGNKQDSSESVPADSIAPGQKDVEEEPIPVPDNDKAERIIAKFNQGPAINNTDYADALDYAELYLMLSSDPLALIHGTPDDAERKAAFDAMADIQEKYPYNEQLMEILSQGADLKKTEGGLVPMNEDNRARLDALNSAYDQIAQ